MCLDFEYGTICVQRRMSLESEAHGFSNCGWFRNHANIIGDLNCVHFRLVADEFLRLKNSLLHNCLSKLTAWAPDNFFASCLMESPAS